MSEKEHYKYFFSADATNSKIKSIILAIKALEFFRDKNLLDQERSDQCIRFYQDKLKYYRDELDKYVHYKYNEERL